MSRRAIRDFCCDSVLWINIIIIAIVFAFVEVHTDSAKSNYEEGYVDACKDFYQGKLKYDLVENPDGTKEWKKIEK